MIVVSVFNAEGPPVPIPNTEVKLCSADNTCLETSREDRSMLTRKFRETEFLLYPEAKIRRKRASARALGRVVVGHFIAEGPPVPIPNTEVKLCGADNTWWETAREDRSWPTLFLLSSVGRAPDC